jgi:type II secretory pathway pseudopilin PulG
MKNRIASRRFGSRWRSALTLVELVVVMVVLVALSGILIPMFGNLTYQSKMGATMETLRRLQELIRVRYVSDMGGVFLTQGTPPGANPDGLPRATPTAAPQMKYLYVDPNAGTTSAGFNATTGLGWNGPYMLGGQGVYPGMNPNAAANGFGSVFGSVGDPTPLDGWGNPIVLVQITDQTNSTYYVVLSAGQTEKLGEAISPGYTGPPIAATVSTVGATAAPGSSVLDNVATTRTLTTNSDGITYKFWLPLQ